MKSVKYHIGLLCSILLLTGCDDFLEEEPKDFYSPENSLITTEHFQSSLNFLYHKTRGQIFNINPDARFAMYYATDFAHNSTDYHKPQKLNDYRATMVPTFGVVHIIWNENYDVINNANVILNRITKTEQVNAENKAIIEGEAKFFRAYSYRNLAHLFGGVPISLEEITVPRRDFVRATREEVYKQCKKDLEEAIAVLPNIETVKPGKVSKQLAQHYLCEIDISLGLYDEAVAAASAVIDYPEVGLMTERFGSRMNEEGDVYWDLFRLNNQNRSSGNKEGLWVFQYDYQNEGSANYNMAWALGPFYQNNTITVKDASGKEVTTTAFLGVTDGKCGRSIGWIQPTKYFFNDVWAKGSENDIRNSKFNIIRDVKIDNPKSPAFGKWFVKDGYSTQVDPIRQWYPIITKFYRVGNVPEEYWKKDNNGEPIVTAFGEHVVLNNATNTYKDEYNVRLAETYLLRAEAYIMKGDNANCVKDINTIRLRAHADPAKAEEMNMDYILEERLRELYGEETRMITLCRLGKLVERNRKYNPVTGVSIDDYHNLWPIPFNEIERNTDAVIEQNPGY